MARSRGSVRPGVADDVDGADGVDATIARVHELLRARGERMTGPRRAVLTVLARHAEHLSAEDVVARVTAEDPSVHRASVYRTLEALSDLGVVQHVHVSRGTAYHLVGLVGDREAHLHAQCRRCGSVHDLPADLLDEVGAVLAREHGFELEAGHVALSGLCEACRSSS